MRLTLACQAVRRTVGNSTQIHPPLHLYVPLVSPAFAPGALCNPIPAVGVNRQVNVLDTMSWMALLKSPTAWCPSWQQQDLMATIQSGPRCSVCLAPIYAVHHQPLSQTDSIPLSRLQGCMPDPMHALDSPWWAIKVAF